MQVLDKVRRFARKSPDEQVVTLLYHYYRSRKLASVPCSENHRTAYFLGLFGTGRWYVNGLILKNIGERAQYFRDEIRLHAGPTSMIYSGHATLKHASHLQVPPPETKRILEAVSAGFADLIFTSRHPLDALLTNWAWWRPRNRDKGATVSQLYKSTDALCDDLQRNFDEFRAFADGDPDILELEGGARFLSFAEFLEETELFLQAATLSLQLEEFMTAPVQAFTKILNVMSLDVDRSPSRVKPPRTVPYRYLTVMSKVPRFRGFVDGLGAQTHDAIERIGYRVTV